MTPFLYDYVVGYNLANSEMGHLFYTELGNVGYQNVDGSFNIFPPAPEYFLQNTGNFDNLVASTYWANIFENIHTYAWYFNNHNGGQNIVNKASHEYFGIAVHEGEVSIAPVPEPATMLLLGTGLIFMSSVGRKKLFKK